MNEDENFLTEKYLRDLSAFDEAAFHVLDGIKCGTEVEFKCPICGGKAHAGRSAYNGHAHAKCESCGFAFIQ